MNRTQTRLAVSIASNGSRGAVGADRQGQWTTHKAAAPASRRATNLLRRTQATASLADWLSPGKSSALERPARPWATTGTLNTGRGFSAVSCWGADAQGLGLGRRGQRCVVKALTQLDQGFVNAARTGLAQLLDREASGPQGQ
jgi:hypothetical protein